MGAYAKAFLSNTRQPEVRILKTLTLPKFVSLSVYSYRDDLPENASKTTFQECKKSASR